MTTFCIELTVSPTLLSLLQQLVGSLGSIKELPEVKDDISPIPAVEVAHQPALPVSVSKPITASDNKPSADSAGEDLPYELFLPTVRDKAMHLGLEGKTGAVKALISEFGAECLSQISRERIVEFYNKLGEL